MIHERYKKLHGFQDLVRLVNYLLASLQYDFKIRTGGTGILTSVCHPKLERDTKCRAEL